MEPLLSVRKIKSFIDLGALHINRKISLNSSRVLPPSACVSWNRPHFQFDSLPDALPVLFEDEYLMIVNKPCGLLSHSDHKDVKHCQSLLRKQYKNPNIQVAHRLDQYTSGILIAAKTSGMFTQLTGLFKNKQVHKEYQAITVGQWSKPKGIIRNVIYASKEHGMDVYKVSSNIQRGGRPAETYFEVVSSHLRYAWVKFRPVTGRTHQIRVHAAWVRCPLLGDWVYADQIPAGLHPGRYMLHATEVSFNHPVTGQKIQVSSTLPDEFDYFFRRLKLI